jgi:hypothetical protein
MPGRKKKKKNENKIFDSIRKPVAPPTKKFGEAKPESRIHPADRKIKHKKQVPNPEE